MSFFDTSNFTLSSLNISFIISINKYGDIIISIILSHVKECFLSNTMSSNYRFQKYIIPHITANTNTFAFIIAVLKNTNIIGNNKNIILFIGNNQ